MAFILMQSYTANLSAILTLDQLKFAFSDSYYVGCQEGSFMKEFLIEQLHISASRLRSYTSVDEYHKAMSLGSKNGGIDAIFDEIPYMKLFLNKYDSQYKMVGPTYRTGGFGFVSFSIQLSYRLFLSGCDFTYDIYFIGSFIFIIGQYMHIISSMREVCCQC